MATASELAEAKAALHSLLTGTRVTSVTKNGRSVTFTSATLGELKNYIAEMEVELGMHSRRRRPLGVRL